MSGKTIRINRIFKRKKALIMALDYGLFSGVPDNFPNLRHVLERVNADLLDGIVITPGQLKNLPMEFQQTNLIVRVDGCTVFGEFNATEMICDVERAARMGADAILAFTLLNDKSANLELIKRLKLLNQASEAVGLPLIAEYLPTGTEIKQRDAIRIIAEIGADIIKTNIPDSPEELQDIKTVSELPVLLAGGSKTEDKEMLAIVKNMISAGADGVVFGRNAWNRNDINSYLEQLTNVIYS